MDIDDIQNNISEHKGCWECGCLTAIVAAVALSIGSCSLLNHVEYGDGVRAGMINKISKRGYIWKTYEGQMALEGLASHGESIGANVWDFSLDSNDPNAEELAKQIQGYIDSGTKVKATYTQKWTSWPPRAGTDYYIKKVTPVNSHSPKAKK